MPLKKILSISFWLISIALSSQTVGSVYKINDLMKRISRPDTTWVVNFWATWCKPCIQEMPAFDSLRKTTENSNVKILLVCLDFREDLNKKVNPFLLKNQIKSECVLLDEVNGNDFINQIDKNWSGAIPATLFKKGDKKLLIEKKSLLNDLKKGLSDLRN